MAGPMVRLATYLNSIEAELARNRLAGAGIPAFLSGEASGTLFAGLGSALAQIELYVPEENLGAAEAVLERLDEEEDTDDDVQENLDPETGISEADRETRAETEEAAGNNPAIRPGLPPAPLPDEEPASFAEEEDEEADEQADSSITWTPERLASRALRSAVIGLVVLPPLFHIYSLWLLLQMASLPEEAGSARARTVYAALILDLLGLVAFGPFCCGFTFWLARLVL